MPFATFERHIRDELGRMLGAADFDPAGDILALTVNRWPHGYTYEYIPCGILSGPRMQNRASLPVSRLATLRLPMRMRRPTPTPTPPSTRDIRRCRSCGQHGMRDIRRQGYDKTPSAGDASRWGRDPQTARDGRIDTWHPALDHGASRGCVRCHGRVSRAGMVCRRS